MDTNLLSFLTTHLRQSTRHQYDDQNNHIEPNAFDKSINTNITFDKVGRISAVASVGQSKVICEIQTKVGIPITTAPEKGELKFQLLFLPNHVIGVDVRVDKRESNIIESTLDTIYASDQAFDRRQLLIEKGLSAFVLDCHIIICTDHGYLLDTMILAINAALLNIKLPHISYKNKVIKILSDRITQLHVDNLPIAVTTSLHIQDNKGPLSSNYPSPSPSASSNHKVITIFDHDMNLYYYKVVGNALLTVPDDVINTTIQQAQTLSLTRRNQLYNNQYTTTTTTTTTTNDNSHLHMMMT